MESSGNVFADLGMANPEQELLKAKLTLQIYKTIKSRNLTQSGAGAILGIKQPHVSSLMRGRSGTFSVERLMDFLRALGHDIEIAVTATTKVRSKGQAETIADLSVGQNAMVFGTGSAGSYNAVLIRGLVARPATS